jgi:Ala-tRNA(Pro) deacylase
MAIATWMRDELKQRGVAFQERHHADACTAQQMAQKEHISGHRVAKVVWVLADQRLVELILPASRRIVPEEVRRLLGARLVRLATEDEMREWFTDCELGSIPPMRHWRTVEVLADGHLRTPGDILIPGGTHHDAVLMSFDDWFAMVQPRVECFCEPADPEMRMTEE